MCWPYLIHTQNCSDQIYILDLICSGIFFLLRQTRHFWCICLLLEPFRRCFQWSTISGPFSIPVPSSSSSFHFWHKTIQTYISKRWRGFTRTYAPIFESSNICANALIPLLILIMNILRCLHRCLYTVVSV